MHRRNAHTNAYIHTYTYGRNVLDDVRKSTCIIWERRLEHVHRSMSVFEQQGFNIRETDKTRYTDLQQQVSDMLMHTRALAADPQTVRDPDDVDDVGESETPSPVQRGPSNDQATSPPRNLMDDPMFKGHDLYKVCSMRVSTYISPFMCEELKGTHTHMHRYVQYTCSWALPLPHVHSRMFKMWLQFRNSYPQLCTHTHTHTHTYMHIHIYVPHTCSSTPCVTCAGPYVQTAASVSQQLPTAPST
jgi:hypothetical protein